MAAMRIVTAVTLFCLLSFASTFLPVNAQKTTLLFSFGDSWADTGNTPKSGPNFGRGWVYPDGITWPGQPAGRVSDGKIQTDWFADILGLSYPPSYLYSAGQSTSTGLNFAVAGSGVTYASGVATVPLGTQVDNFELFLRTDPYSKTALANSLTLVSVVGNDYFTFTGKTSAELFVFIETVVSGIQTNLQRLYDLGVRDVMVSNMAPVGCLPIYTRSSGYRTCDNSVDSYVQIHNAFLLGAVRSINAQNPGARFIILDQYAAFGHLFKQAAAVGFTDRLKPCCEGINTTTSCGDVDSSGKWLYTVCKKRGKAVFWNDMHPSMWAWNYIVQLYMNHPDFILLSDAPTLKNWLKINDYVQEPVAAPMAQPDTSFAAGQFEAAFNFLLGMSNYSEAFGLLQSMNLETILAKTPQSVVTVFLPTNQAFSIANTFLIDQIFAMNEVSEAAEYHAVKGYYDLNALIAGKPAFLTTLSSQQLPIFYPPQGIYVGANYAAKVVDPNLYTVPGQVAIHGIDHVLISGA